MTLFSDFAKCSLREGVPEKPLVNSVECVTESTLPPCFAGLLGGDAFSEMTEIPLQTRAFLVLSSSKFFTLPLSFMTRENPFGLPRSSPSSKHHDSHAANRSPFVTHSSGPNTHSLAKNLSTTSVSSRYFAVAASTAAAVPSPCSCHSTQPRTAQSSTPASSSRSFSGSLGSAFLPSNRCVNGIRRRRSQMASEPSGISGLWFVLSHRVNCGRYENGRPNGAR